MDPADCNGVRKRGLLAADTTIQQSRSVGKAVLSALALQIVSNLLGGRLPDAHNGAASQTIRGYLRHRASARFSIAFSGARFIASAMIGDDNGRLLE
jgi:hypothetical protein